MDETEQQAYARRYAWLRENWETLTGTTWREPIAPRLDAHIDAAMQGVAAAESVYPGNAQCHPQEPKP